MMREQETTPILMVNKRVSPQKYKNLFKNLISDF